MPRRAASPARKSPAKPASKGKLLFPGGGTFFWWQIGAAQKLCELYDLSEVELCGCSAGALAAAFARCGVDPAAAYAYAFEIADRAQIFERPLGLFGKWGALVEDWLERMLPADVSACDGTIAIAVTRMVPLPHPVRVRRFADRAELIGALRASTHLPLFLDGRLLSRHAGGWTADGGLLQWFGLRSNAGVLGGGGDAGGGAHTLVECTVDARFMAACAAHGWGPLSPHGTDAFIRYGAEFVTAQARLGPDGHFAALEPLRKGGRRAPAGRRRPAFEPPAPPPRPFFRSEYGAIFVPRAMLSALLALLLFVARLPARAAARLSSRRGY